jgi:cobyrinic acid a,c-diamide synthase
MLSLPRLAVGTIQEGADAQLASWALMESLVQAGCQVQHFFSRSCFSPRNAALAITGVGSRHVDPWLMPKSVCRESFVHGCAGRDLGLIEGHFGATRGAAAHESPDDESSSQDLAVTERPNSLDLLCDWLDVPRLVVLDVSRLRQCDLPERPHQIDGLVLDRVSSLSDAFRLQTTLEALWDVPVLGALPELPQWRAAKDLSSYGVLPPRAACRELGAAWEAFAESGPVRELADRRALADVSPNLFGRSNLLGHPNLLGGAVREYAEGQGKRPPPARKRLTVAVAYDAAFNCYFPDTLDLLELEGAKVVDFSPLRDELLPEADVVYLGCGQPDQYADCLSRNHCMLLALRNHVRGGRRVYAEGGGLAYLCERIETPRGELVPMVGALPAVARANQRHAPPLPIEVTFARGNWLGPAGTSLRGYLNSHWVLEPVGPLNGYLADPGHEFDMVGQYQVIGSRLHFNFAAQIEALRAFFKPRGRAMALSAAP